MWKSQAQGRQAPVPAGFRGRTQGEVHPALQPAWLVPLSFFFLGHSIPDSQCWEGKSSWHSQGHRLTPWSRKGSKRKLHELGTACSPEANRVQLWEAGDPASSWQATSSKKVDPGAPPGDPDRQLGVSMNEINEEEQTSASLTGGARLRVRVEPGVSSRGVSWEDREEGY